MTVLCIMRLLWEVITSISGTFRQTGVNDNNNNDNINNDEENDDYDCDHKIAKQEQRNRENRFDGLRLSSDVRLSLILFLIWINCK